MMKSKAAKKKMLSEAKVKRFTKVLVDWCKKKGIDVRFDEHEDDMAHPWVNKIFINTETKTKENVLYALIHELGHILQQSFNAGGYYEKFGAVIHNPKYGSRNYKLLRLQEEMEAWDIGLERAKNLDIQVDVVNYNKIRSSSLLSYAEAVVAKPLAKRQTRKQKNVGNKLNDMFQMGV